MYWSVLNERKTRELAYEFVKAHYDTLTARLPRESAAYFAFAGSAFCDPRRRDDAASFFGERNARADGPRDDTTDPRRVLPEARRIEDDEVEMVRVQVAIAVETRAGARVDEQHSRCIRR